MKEILHKAVKLINNDTVAWIAWVVFTGVIALVVFVTFPKHSVLHSYWDASQNWWQSKDLYPHLVWYHNLKVYVFGGMGYLYMPQSAILFTPFTWLPRLSGEIIFRVISIAALAFSLREFLKPFQIKLFPMATLFTLALLASSARNGQMNVLMVALMFFSLAQLQKEHWTKAAILLMLCFAFKTTSIVLVLLVAALYFKPMAWRLFLGGLIVFAFPFLTQKPDYVISQYFQYHYLLQSATAFGLSRTNWASIFGLIGQFGVHFNMTFLTIIRGIMALVTLWVAWVNHRRNETPGREWILYTLAALYLLLMNPDSENTDYMMLGPVLAVFVLNAFQQSRIVESCVMGFLWLGMVNGYNMSVLLHPHHKSWFAPLMGLIFTIYVVTYCFRGGFMRNLNYTESRGKATTT